jgi:AraC-like DNA-binding protein
MSSQKQEQPQHRLLAFRHAPPAGPRHGSGVAPRPASFAEEVRRNIRGNLDNPNLSAATVAKLHGIDRRTLSRRLSAEGTSFSKLHRSLRYERACKLLCETAAPLSAITAALGYSEQSAFNRAFQIWSGTSPKRFRSS